MASGYEKSPDYGGPELKPWLWAAGALAVLAALYFWIGR